MKTFNCKTGFGFVLKNNQVIATYQAEEGEYPIEDDSVVVEVASQKDLDAIPRPFNEYLYDNGKWIVIKAIQKEHALQALKSEYDKKLVDFADAYVRADLLSMYTGLIKIDAQKCYQEYITKKEIIENK